jgi:hypothetical protein
MYALETMALEASTQDNFPIFIKGLALEEAGQTTAIVAPASYIFDSQDIIQLAAGNLANLVMTPAAGGNPYIAGTDYSLDAVNGIITRIAGGAIASGAAVSIAYSYSETVTAIAGGTPYPTAPTN